MFLSTLLLVLPVLPLSLGFADPELHARSRSRAHAHRGMLEKRQGFGGRATFYDVGLGACGGYNVASDFIVALNSPQFGGGYPGPNCGRAITISYGGKTANAVVRDQCPGCGYGDLDFSRGLFNYFASEDVGTFQMSWSWSDSPAPAPAPSTTEKPTPTSTYTPPPTSTYTPPSSTSTTPAYTPSSTSTYSPPPSSSSSAAPSSSSSSAAASSASSSASASRISQSALDDVVSTATGPAGPAQTGVIANAGVLVLLNQAVANLGRVVVVGAQA
ncbi:RlpA-like double-psi beta-barrel-protein domain-containing protein-containing protein [Dioszegia hungarica]|uniref:RlpA-like double-psi beta-barrel-protein domain-containing protein-containing protein n=1 Tax=Dioszegia hungarica TaxID=4972 RepID=A0AA38HGE7_9TREE|nr:RlpA-like double-psi beta-barrel-protein domain-containing protein-containing protein [Dioszegia hungarica]KAI9638364.1 RlpA-like double-psi beta-barrel-protein domain-containing protein-containing protein [Dioszegia hungarica]